MNIQESLKTKLDDKIDSLIKTFLEETKNDFDIIWDDFIGEAKDKKAEVTREGFALQERNKILKEEAEELEITITSLNKEKNVLNNDIEDYDKQISSIEKGKQENTDKIKQLNVVEERLTEERLEIKASREKMKTEMILLKDKEISIKRAFSQLDK